MTATRKILLLLFCTTASVALAAQEAKDDTSKSEDKPAAEQKNPAQPGRIPMIFGPVQGQNPWVFGGTPGGNEKKDDGKEEKKDENKNDNPWQNSPWGQPGGGFGGGPGKLEHLEEVFRVGKADAVLAASIFHFGTYTVPQAKAFLKEKGISVRI